MKRQGGFTLIELVVVIVILGILAVTAAPRFLNLQDDAKNSTLQGLRGAISGAMGISYGKAAIEGIEAQQYVAASAAATTIDGIAHSFGYPIATSAGIGSTIDQSGEFVELSSTGTVGTDATLVYGIQNFTGSCVRYSEATAANAPATAAIVVPGEDNEPNTACD
ncbi:type II secretion system protein [Vibrio crassostreae]|uniref:type II secretion system protein n=1 Tax=Vibrio crassostreae TaxID=246167 RepID=UPI000F472C12|nr:type II secretion system protein [Vibrio crassostreae]NOH74583.1 type II secretion system protein [Vibrio crassostreae]ROR15573.1 MSHA pilin protein MshA [Vibrio crassostreae]TCV22034.1 MSHA pilin protein MshA [Vibrio crassostreae]CAK1751502.1 MSHA pilin protein MshA [Vibrio crassostreae]CAK2269876.1 MSHA pilin protein MshA [Vibrio crassostreae]